MQVLTIEQLSKTYANGVQAMDCLSLEIGTGMFGLLGPNGAGKSTLMRTLATLQHPDSGRITFCGIDVLQAPMELRKQLGYLPQDFGVYPRVSAEALLDYFALLKGIAQAKDRKAAVQHVLELTHLYEVRNKYVSDYSGGMKQRFGIAQVLLNRPRLLIVDEPTAGLDPAERSRFLNVLRAAGTASTVIFSTHIVEDVTDLCTDMAIMNRGAILQHTSPALATQQLAGKVWTRRLLPAALPQAEAAHCVLSSGFDADHALRIRVFAAQSPGEAFVAAPPRLEDAYFLALKTAPSH